MSLLYDGVFSSVSLKGRGDFQFSNITYAHKMLLKSISKRQRSKFKKKGTIPPQLLRVLWDLGWIPGDSAPKMGMRINVLLNLLQNGPFRNEDQRKQCSWLYEKIVKEELMPKPQRLATNRERFLKVGQQFVPLFEIRKRPGTVV